MQLIDITRLSSPSFTRIMQVHLAVNDKGQSKHYFEFFLEFMTTYSFSVVHCKTEVSCSVLFIFLTRRRQAHHTFLHEHIQLYAIYITHKLTPISIEFPLWLIYFIRKHLPVLCRRCENGGLPVSWCLMLYTPVTHFNQMLQHLSWVYPNALKHIFW